MHDTWLSEGKRKRKTPAATDIREYALDQIVSAPNPFRVPA